MWACACLAAWCVGCKGLKWGVDFAGNGAGIGAAVEAAGFRLGVQVGYPVATNRISRSPTNSVEEVGSGSR